MSKKKVSKEIWDQVIGLVRGAFEIRAIGRTLGIPRSTVSYISRKWRKLGTTSNIKRSGRPKKLSSRGSRQLKGLVKKNRRATLRQLTE